MRITTKDLKVGAVMNSGEVVKKVQKSGKGYLGNVKLFVILEKPDGTKRSVWWNYFGTVFVRSN